MKLCTLCKEEKPLKEFNPNKRYKDGFYKHCKKCHYEYYGRPKHISRKYGLTAEDYSVLLKKQKYMCFGCETEHKDKAGGRLFVDHCHSTGKVRGLLCNNCNFAIGSAKDSVEILERLIKYLKEANVS